MKKILMLAASLLLTMSTFAGSQGDDNGLGVKIFGGFGEQFGTMSLNDYKSDFGAKPRIGIAVDNRWYVANPGIFGIAVNARWVDFSFNKFKDIEKEVDSDILEEMGLDKFFPDYRMFSIDALNVGAIGTVYINDKVAVDLFYNVGPSFNAFVFDVIDEEVEDLVKEVEVDDESVWSFGVCHKIGAAFRYKILQVGVEGKIGNLHIKDWGMENELLKNFNKVSNLDPRKKVNSFRVFVGFKF